MEEGGEGPVAFLVAGAVPRGLPSPQPAPSLVKDGTN